MPNKLCILVVSSIFFTISDMFFSISCIFPKISCTYLLDVLDILQQVFLSEMARHSKRCRELSQNHPKGTTLGGTTLAWFIEDCHWLDISKQISNLDEWNWNIMKHKTATINHEMGQLPNLLLNE